MIAHLALLLAAAAGGENRLWFVEFELHGACEEVRLDCGPAGATRIVGPFASGEERRVRVPVPVRSPLGSAGLDSVPLPRASALPAGSPATVEVRGWSAVQPGASLERLAGALCARPRPASTSPRPRAGWPELVLVLAAGGFALRFRGRPWLVLALALASGFASLQLARARRGDARVERVLEWEAGGELALTVSVAADELVLPREWLEVEPVGRALEFVVTGTGAVTGAGTVRAGGARLAGLERAEVPRLEPRENGLGPLAEVWTRAAGGEWSARGAWPAGAPLPGPAPGGADPPGWLASALPPGRTVLLGRTSGGEWLRGFDW